MGSNKALIGKNYPEAPWTAEVTRLSQFAAATDDVHPAYEGPQAIVQPMAVVLASVPLGAMHVVCDGPLIGDPQRLLRLLHSAEDVTWRRPLRPGEKLWVTATLQAIESTAAGETLQVVTRLASTPGAPADDWIVRTESHLFIRERTRAAPRRCMSKTTSAFDEAPIVKQHVQQWQVAPDQSARYAAASGDRNPIHLEDEVAKRAGLRGRILHGLCTMTFAQRAVVQGFGANNPSVLRRLAVRFVRPVYLGDRLTFSGQCTHQGHITFVVHNQGGQNVLANGIAQVVVLLDGAKGL